MEGGENKKSPVYVIKHQQGSHWPSGSFPSPGERDSGQVKGITAEGLGRRTEPAALPWRRGVVRLERDTGEPVTAERCDPRTAEVRRHRIQALKAERYSDR